MEASETLAAIALTRIPGIGSLTAHTLVKELGSARRVFECKAGLPEILPGVASRVVNLLAHPEEAFRLAAAEYAFAERNGIRCLSYWDSDYPSRLRECADAPVVLYYKGTADLNVLRIVSIVGTRRVTSYGKTLCEDFVKELAQLCPEVLVISGLAYGVDIHAHRAALLYDLPTLGVLAHGLDRIYPSLHRQTAVQMLEKGGLLTEFPINTNPDRANFVMRNRIVAGMADATVVVESAAKGGSLITAEIAQGYGRDCFSFPGKVGDEYSAGCNRLIASQAAQLITCAEDFVKCMGWEMKLAETKSVVQRELFMELSEEEEKIIHILHSGGEMQINALVVAADLPVHRLSALLFEMEMKGMVRALQGGVFRLI